MVEDLLDYFNKDYAEPFNNKMTQLAINGLNWSLWIGVVLIMFGFLSYCVGIPKIGKKVRDWGVVLGLVAILLKITYDC